MKSDKGRVCEYCNKQTHMVMQGYATHLRIKHPEVWEAGKVLFPNDPAWTWPENLGQSPVNSVVKAEPKKLGRPKLKPAKLVEDIKQVSQVAQYVKELSNGAAPTFSMGATNALAIPVLSFYRSLVSGIEVDRVNEAIDIIVEWQKDHPTEVKVPFAGGK